MYSQFFFEILFLCEYLYSTEKSFFISEMSQVMSQSALGLGLKLGLGLGMRVALGEGLPVFFLRLNILTHDLLTHDSLKL